MVFLCCNILSKTDTHKEEKREKVVRKKVKEREREREIVVCMYEREIYKKTELSRGQTHNTIGQRSTDRHTHTHTHTFTHIYAPYTNIDNLRNIEGQTTINRHTTVVRQRHKHRTNK